MKMIINYLSTTFYYDPIMFRKIFLNPFDIWSLLKKSIFLLWVLCFYSNSLSANKIPPSLNKQSNISIETLLNLDGTINLSKGLTGSISLAGYHIRMDENKGIIASPVDESITTGSWSTLGVGLNDQCQIIAVDGDGNVYAGGRFTAAGGIEANRIAKWDGSSWSALGSGFNGRCFSIDIDDSGDVYAGGEFTTAGGNPANYIAKWDGISWSALSSGLNAKCYALVVDSNENVYVGGQFTTAGGNSANRIAKWDGTSWSALGVGIDGPCYALAMGNSGNLYAGGPFTNAGGNSANSIAKWDGTSWSALGSGLSGSGTWCETIAVDGNGNVYAGGEFTMAGGSPANAIAKWDGSVWSALGEGVDRCIGLAIDNNGNVYAGRGDFGGGGGLTDGIAMWDGTSWSALGSGLNQWTYSVAIDGNGDVFVGGTFTTADGLPANRIAKYEVINPPSTPSWSSLGSGVSNNWTHAVALDGSGNIYVGGLFTAAGGIPANYIAKWDGTSWSALGSGLGGGCYSIVVDDSGNVYASGSFTTAGGNSANRIAKWDGSLWSPLGTGFDNLCFEIILDSNDNIYAVGRFTAAGGIEANQIAKWDGTSWSALGDGLNGECRGITIDDLGNIYVAGLFTNAGGVPANRIAKWDGTSWSALGSGLNNWCQGIATDGNGNVYVGGDFTTAGGNLANRIAKWDGTSWSALSSGLNGHSYFISTDGNGNLYAGGGFTVAGSIGANRIAKWDGSSWSSLGSGLNERCYAITTDLNENVFVAGEFSEAGGITTNYVAKYGIDCTANPISINSTSTNITCSGANTGSIDLTVSGGSTPYTFLWNDGNINENRTGLSAGDYFVTVTDNDGCQLQEGPISIIEENGSLDFDGLDDYVIITDNGVLDPLSFTLEAWVNTTSMGNHFVLTKQVASSPAQGRYDLRVRDGVAYISSYNANGIYSQLFGTSIISDGTWHHIAAVFDKTENYLALYVNGQLENQTTTPSAPNAVGSDFITIGRWPAPWQQFYIGKIDEVRIWDTPLDSTTIQTWKDQYITDDHPNYSNLLGYWKFDEGSGQISHSEVNSPLLDGQLGSTTGADEADPTWDLIGGCSTCPLIIDYMVTDVSCLDGNTGSIDLTVSGEIAPYTFLWNDGNTNEDRTGLSAGDYFVTVTDNDGCQTQEGPITISEENSSLDLDGLDDYIIIEDGGTLSMSSYTLESWVKTTELGVQNVMIKYHPDVWGAVRYLFRVWGGVAVFGVGPGSNWDCFGSTMIADGNWHHIAAVFDSDELTITLYVDGNIECQTAAPGSQLSADDFLYIGKSSLASIQGFKGGLDEMRIWDAPLDQATIQAWMSEGVNSNHPNYSNLLGYWKFDEGSGQIAHSEVNSPLLDGQLGSTAGTDTDDPTWTNDGILPPCPTCITTTIEDVNIFPNHEITVPVTVSNADSFDIGAITLTIDYDETQLTLIENPNIIVHNPHPNLNGGMTNNICNGRVCFNWTNFSTPANFTEGDTLFELKFQGISNPACFLLSFDNTFSSNNEYADTNGEVICDDDFLGIGNLCVNDASFNPDITLPNCEDAIDGSVSVNVTGGTSPYTYEWSTGGNLISTDNPLDSVEYGTYDLLVTDANGSTADTTFIIDDFEDTIAPVIDTCIANQEVDLNSTTCEIIVPNLTLEPISVSDNCTNTVNLIITQSPLAGDTIELVNGDSTAITIIVTDEAANSTDCVLYLIARDTTPPEMICPTSPPPLSTDANCEAAIPDLTAEVVITDACENPNNNSILIIQDPLPGTMLGLGVHTITLTATDPSENIATCTVDITVEDDFPPVAICQDITVQIQTDGQYIMNAGELDNGSSDACGGSVSFSLNGQADTTWTCNDEGTHLVILTVTDADGNIASCEGTVTVQCQTISGFVYYGDSNDKRVYGSNGEVSLTLLDTNSNAILGPIDVTTIDGYYEFKPVPDGDYSIETTITYDNNDCGGINSTDALKVMLHVVGIEPLVDVELLAGEAGSTTGVTAQDATEIKKFSAGLIDEFTTSEGLVLSDWVSTTPTLSLNGSSLDHDVRPLLRGDVNSSSNLECVDLVGGGMEESNLEIIMDQERGLFLEKKENALVIPLMADVDLEVSAITLNMHFWSNALEITGISLAPDQSAQELLYTIKDDVIRVSWFNLAPLKIEQGEPLLYLYAIVKEELPNNDNLEQRVQLIKDTELADKNGNRIKGVKLYFPKLTLLSTATQDLFVEDFSFEIYPNPFKDRTTIEYQLTESARVNFQLFNLTGALVKERTLLNQLNGSHSINLEVENLEPGLYLLQANVETSSGLLKTVKKLVIQ